MPQKNAGLPSSVEAEKALKMNPCQDVRLKQSARENCHAVETVVLQNHRVNVHLIANAVGMSTGSVKTILRNYLLMTKACAQWVPQMFDKKMMDCRRETSSENLKFMQ